MNKKILFKNLGFLLSDNVIKLVIGFFISIFIARYLGSENLGKVNYVIAFLGFYEILIIFGMDVTLTKEIGLNLESGNKIISSIIIFRIVMFLVTLPFWILLFFMFGNSDTKLNIIFYLSLINIFLTIFLVPKNYYQAMSLNKYDVMASQIGYIIAAFLKIFFVYFHGNVYTYVLITVGEKLIYIVLIWFFYLKKEKFRFELDKFFLKKIIKESFPLLLVSVSIFIYMKIDQLMVGKMLGMKQVGVYSIGVKLAELVYFIPMAVSTAYFPKILHSKKEKTIAEYENEVVKLGRINVFICFIFSLGATLFGKEFVKLVYGVEYIKSGEVFVIYSWASIFVALGVSHGNYMVIEEKNKYSFNATILGAIMNVILNYVLIPKYGIIGTSYATVISQWISSYLYYYFSFRKTFFMRTKSFNIVFILINEIKKRRSNE